MQAGLDRTERDPEDIRDLGQQETLDVVQHDDRALLDVETSERPVELVAIDETR